MELNTQNIPFWEDLLPFEERASLHFYTTGCSLHMPATPNLMALVARWCKSYGRRLDQEVVGGTPRITLGHLVLISTRTLE